MKLILRLTNTLFKGKHDGMYYVSDEKLAGRKPPNGAVRADSGKGWYIKPGSAPELESKDEEEDKEGKDKSEKDKEVLPQLESAQEKVTVPSSTSTKQVAPEITKQTGLKSPQKEDADPNDKTKAFNAIKQKIAEDGPGAFTADQHLTIAAAAKAAGDKEMAEQHKNYAKDISNKQKITDMEAMLASRGEAKGKMGWNPPESDHKKVAEMNEADEDGFEHSIESIPIDSIDLPKARDEGRTASVKQGLKDGSSMPAIRVGEGKDGKWTIEDGVHRTNAALESGATHVPAIVSKKKGAEFHGPVERSTKPESTKPKRSSSKKEPKVETEKKDKAELSKEEARKQDFHQSIDKVSSYLDEMKSRVPENSKEYKQIQEVSKILATTKNESPSTVGGYDVKAGYNLAMQIRQKVAAGEDSLAKEAANKIADRMEHESKLIEVAARIEDEVGNAVDPAKKKILESHLSKLKKQMDNKGELGSLDAKDLAQAESDLRSISKQNIKDAEAAPEKARKKLTAEEREAAKKKRQAESEAAKTARKEESLKRKANIDAEKAKKTAEKNKAQAFKTEQHKKDAGKLHSDIQEALSQSSKHIDDKDFRELTEHAKAIEAHGDISQVTGKESVELSRAKSALNKVNRKIDSKVKKEQAQAQSQNKKLVVQNNKVQAHKQHVKDTVNHIKSAMSAIGSGHPMHAELEDHMNKILKQTPQGTGFTKAQQKEVMEAYSAASKAHRASYKPAKPEKAAKPEKKTFFKENAPSSSAATKKPGVSVSGASQRGVRIGSRVASATKTEESAPAGDLAGDAAISGVSKLFAGAANSAASKPSKESTISSKKEEVKDDTKKVKKSVDLSEELDYVNSVAKSLTGYKYIPARESFERYLGTKVESLTGRVRYEYYDFINKSLTQVIEGLDVE